MLVTAVLVAMSAPAQDAGVQVATLLAPAHGAANVGAPTTFQWSAVTGVQAYYLYVGTTPGAKDVVNTGETLNTSYTKPLPDGQTLYARLWTKRAGVWQYTDSTFSTAPHRARLTSPADGEANVSVPTTFQWTTVPDAQTYYLYVGTSPGATDVVNSGETSQVSYAAGNLPEDRLLHVRLWTKLAGVWRYRDSTFTTQILKAKLIAPANGAAVPPLGTAFQWTSVPAVQAYYLYVGTSAGAKDVVNTGEMAHTTYTAALPEQRTLHVRLWTKTQGVWRYVDSTIATTSLRATLTSPAHGAQAVPPSTRFQWTAVPGVQAYYLYVGTSAGAKDVVDTGEVQTTQYDVARLPEGRALNARLWTKAGGAWRYSDSTFTTGWRKARFVHPQDRALAVDLSTPISWTPAAAADAYRLYVAGDPSGHPLYVDSGETTATSYVASGLPADRPLYARILTRTGGAWTFTDAVFTAQSDQPPATIAQPADRSSGFVAAGGFEWTHAPLADAYRIEIGSSPGAADLEDSGPIRVNRRLVSGLPQGVELYGRIASRIGGAWRTSEFTFTVADASVGVPDRIAFAERGAGAVRMMASAGNVTRIGSRLAEVVSETDDYLALCNDYAAALMAMLPELNAGLSVRRLDTAFNANRYDVHTLAELLDTGTGRWLVVDPTLGLSARRTSDGAKATAEDIQAAALSFDWTALAFDWLTPAGDAYARGYYLDYPLLFLTLYHAGTPIVVGAGASPAPYFETVPVPVGGAPQFYAVRCDAGAAQTTAVIDGVQTTVQCLGVDRISNVFRAGAVSAVPGGPAFQTLRLRRFVF
jgi:hypothetical protein